ncbi:LPS-assembly protein LptD [Ponticoccus sp. SC2-23]|nr:LPS-assembly protein LptD [Ponticoccus sp. SC6-9]MBM1223832.1 LPS-assembly protein LptD [Ponticoccus sp. SC6-15]MBM1228910.1 LPS-assembly protein LptD [Ponticoccus sp. SC6-38]MBM1232798.1 LPS-assembly protein LptD [Ponticoccus sp. SC6-45]MBM1237252.1 LPS-assembly protein LptD [Ponticoccus sp. SC6-49]MBM1241809.1 LPS-assembly protein LptD [Ponticoccus sp. SC2-64]MBM1246322.1 LPS-assembly protein LptD [Ponticoccus sp. SC6-42]MBM1250800.1 LPS-assembly protein LptD [Ponticoccus sp. SC6-33]MB
MILRRLIAALVVALWPMILWAQGTASLVADTVTLDGSGRLVAQGNVQAFYDGSTLSAAQIVYDPGSDRLVIEGPIFLRSPDGQIITAERAELDPSFENGLLRGARIVLDQQLQLAANQIARIDNGRYSALTRAVASSCQVCPGRAPLWEIRADSLLHDTEARQLYFENATLRVRGVPILWVPRMRLPDPSNPRSTGLLIPQIRSSDLLGFGLRVPYFITLGENRDLLVAPFVSSETRTLEARYRQAFLEGGLRIDGAISRDSIRPDEWRWYLFSNAIFDIGAGIELRFSGESVSDPFYLRDYGYDDRDRLANRLSLLRVGDTSLFQARGTLYESLRLDEPDASLPPIVLGFAYEETIDTRLLGGRLNWGVSGDATLRSIGAQADDSRDVARLGAELGWQDSWIAPAGLIVDAEAELRLDYYNVEDDPEAGQGWRAGPAAAVTLRWPLVRPGGTDRAALTIEPVVGIGWSESYGFAPPNEDATLSELDEGNLWSLSRFPGDDARERGLRASAGLQMSRTGPAGGYQSLTFGRIYQSRAQPDYSRASGQAEPFSDWLVSAKIDAPGGFGIDARSLFDNSFEFNKTEALISWRNDRIDLSAGYVWLPADPTRERDEVASEWSADVGFQLTPNWSVSAEGRYDVSADELARAGFGVGYRNECVTVDLSVSRRYTIIETVEPATEFGLSVNLTGFSAGRSNAGPAGHCQGNGGP